MYLYVLIVFPVKPMKKSEVINYELRTKSNEYSYIFFHFNEI